MQIGKDKALRLTVIDDSVEAAEAIVSSLRNAGIAVRPTRPENEDELKALLHSQTPDVIIVAWAAPTTPVTVDDLAARPGWSTLSAVADDRVVALDSDIASRWGPRVTEMVASVGAALGIEPVPSSVAPADVGEGTDPT